ncbi:hypothetical protein SAMN05444359_101368 [Neolewinella agarilytica]|uniref:Uncharacterized protein n=1 Tax=Neolewinella agarilytica TaxID=478744 RepID=A0A1H8ZLZ1_9BACT|nr:hypothetical protein SAMN05444359_101368 [Neolewinella agarilytica]
MVFQLDWWLNTDCCRLGRLQVGQVAGYRLQVGQVATCNLKLETCNLKLATCNLQLETCNLPPPYPNNKLAL